MSARDETTQRTLKLTVEYDGTAYGGWQRQINAPTVQAEIEDRLRRMTGEPGLILRGAGRTDAGVHALGQVATFATASTIPLHGLVRGLNGALPPDIGIVAACEVQAGFDARRATQKLYRYRILNAPSRAPMRDRFVWHLRKPLDLSSMQEAATALEGEHDFNAFRASDCERIHAVRRIYELSLRAEHDEIVIDVRGNAFLKNMVRIISGTLVYVGLAKIRPHDVARIRDARQRTLAGVTAPAKGLTLVCVDYSSSPLPLSGR